MKTTLYYVHDPMCSWCWGFSHTYEKLIEELGDDFEIKRLLGGLAADSDEPMSEATKNMIKSAWHKIEATIPGVKFNFDFWRLNTPRRSTYPACRAVISARMQGEQFDAKMTQAIQNAYYHNAQNPSDMDILAALAVNLGLNKMLFIEELNSVKTQAILSSEIEQARSLQANSFPSLIQKIDQSFYSIPIEYCDVQSMFKTVKQNQLEV